MKSTTPPKGLRPEEDLLLCCSRTSVDSESAEKIRVLLEKEINWSYLIDTALRHGLIPLLYRNLKTTHLDAIPNGVLEKLRKYFLINASRNIYLTEELIKLLHLFEKHGITAITYRGPTMAASIYGDITLRQFYDLDILIQNKDVSSTKELLVSQGYHPILNFNNAAEEAVYFGSPYKRSLHFVGEDGKTPLDLHWGIESRYLSFGKGLDLLEHLEQIFLNGQAIKTINTEYLIYLLCIHGAQHRWMQINWICDIAELMKHRRDMDWEEIIHRAHALGIYRMVSCGFLLAVWLLDAGLQEKVLQRIKVDPWVQSMTHQVIRKLFDSKPERPGRFERQMFYLKMIERIEDKARYCFNLVMLPTHAEWSTIPLPKPMYSLYYVVRPVRLAGKYTQKLFKYFY